MADTADTAHVIIRPPPAWGLAILAGLAPLPFLPSDLPPGWLGAMVFVLALSLAAWAIVTMTRAGSNVPTNRPNTTIVESGPYRFTRNPIYLGMVLGLIGLSVAFDTLWLLMMLVPSRSSSATAWWPARRPISAASSARSTGATARAYGAGCSANR